MSNEQLARALERINDCIEALELELNIIDDFDIKITYTVPNEVWHYIGTTNE